MPWVLTAIQPTHFNITSDLLGQLVVGILLLLLFISYPHLVWQSVQHGKGVPLNAVLQPPQSILEALKCWQEGGACCFVLGLLFIITVATFTHAAADLFLEFVMV